MPELGRETRIREEVDACVNYMRSIFSIPVAEHSIAVNDDGTTKAQIKITDKLTNPDPNDLASLAFIEGFIDLSERLRLLNFERVDQAVVEEVGRISAIHACNFAGLSTEGLGLNG